MQDVRAILQEFNDGVESLAAAGGKSMQAFLELQDTVLGDDVLPNKVKELISVGISVYNRCQYCIVYHVYSAYEAGATREEILAAALLSMSGFGAGPSMAYASTTLMDALNEFEHDFK
ncbi:MAG: carboxymuconolactone decarboxylase family protein [Clostridiales bacterium]|nr:carboxymuconolactone decarboxylase family protein [Clostridiales bacterium]